MEKLTFKQGLKDGLPIGLGYLSVSFAFGVWAVGLGVPIFIALLTSMTNLTSAGQFTGTEIIAVGGSIISLILGQLVINSRYFLMGISLTQKLDDSFTFLERLFCGAFITDEIFAVAVTKTQAVNTKYFHGLTVLPYLGWSLGTLFGAIAGNILPEQIVSALNIAIYAMFIAIIIPPAMKSLGVTVSITVATVISCVLYFVPVFSVLTNGLPYIISAILTAILVSVFFPVKNGEKEENENA